MTPGVSSCRITDGEEEPVMESGGGFHVLKINKVIQ